jgi:UDP-N-acetylmuramyl pentapeptide phosphotransferase/UDP-N-acetylglucosamine-1-phosphate transferase
MNTLTRFVRTTILGGVFFLIPIVVLVIVLAKALEYANKALQVIVVHILAASELSATAATVLSVVIVALVCGSYRPLDDGAKIRQSA